jgi:hypothetical protein
LTPAASPLCSTGTALSATFESAGLKSPVPTEAISRPGIMIVHDEVVPASVNRPRPTATSARPPAIIVRAGTLAPICAVAPDTTSITSVPGR